jgi:predicted phosphohydrolase
MVVRIQYASDTHLERKPSRFKHIIKPVGDILVLSGDIGHPFRKIYYQFLKWCSRKFKHVVLIAGNHEYYGSSLKKGKKKLQKICRQTGVSFLDRGVLELPEYNIVILGTTLWSYIPYEACFHVMMSINDYECIEGFTPLSSNELFYDNMCWLRDTIKKYLTETSYEIVVATHHAPIPEITSAVEHRGKRNNCAFASDCSSVMEGAKVWIFGHTHFNTTFEHKTPKGSVIVTCNQRGYPRENTGYDPSKFLEI